MNQPRILLLSPRGLQRSVWICSQIESEDVFAEVDDVEIIAPQLVHAGQGTGMNLVSRGLQWALGLEVKFLPRPQRVKLQRRYDLFFFQAQNLNELALLKAVPGWRESCKRAICWIEELWVTGLAHADKLAVLKQFDHVIVPFHGSKDPLARLIGQPCHWMASAVDTMRFCPWPNPPPRSIDFLAMGRRSRPTHEATLEYASQRGWTYLFDTLEARDVLDAGEHRQQFAELVKRTRFFAVNRAKAGVPSETGAQEEVGYRFFEGAAGGAVLVGEAPRSPVFQWCFDWPDAVIDLPYDSPAPAEVLDELDAQPERVRAISAENARQCLLRHDWAHRWQEVLQLAELPPRERLAQRIRRLTVLANEVGAVGKLSHRA